MRSPLPVPATPGASEARRASTLAALRSAGVRCEYAPAYEGDLYVQGYVVPHNKLVLWLDEGPRLYLRLGQRSWDHRPRTGLLDYFPRGEIDIVRAAPGEIRALLIYVEDGCSETSDFDPGGADASADMQFADARLQRIASRVEAVAARPHLYGPTYCGFLAHALVARLRERHAPARDAPRLPHALCPASSRILVEYVKHAMGSHITIDELAALIGYRPPQFIRSFQATFGMPPHRYLLQQRLARARDLLRASDLALTDIALSLGFASHSHFSTAFRRESGLPPSEYRRNRLPACS